MTHLTTLSNGKIVNIDGNFSTTNFAKAVILDAVLGQVLEEDGFIIAEIKKIAEDNAHLTCKKFRRRLTIALDDYMFSHLTFDSY